MWATKMMTIFFSKCIIFIALLSTINLTTAREVRSFSAPARLEGAAPTIKMAFTIAGMVKEIHARSGETKKRGSPLITLYCDDRIAAVQLAQSLIKETQAEADKTQNGARVEERDVLAARIKVTEADVAAAEKRFHRFDQLKQKGNFISDAELDSMRDALTNARAKNNAMAAEQKLTNAPARQEDLAAVRAKVNMTQAKLAQANAEVEKCTLRAPANIIVLRNLVEAGDSINPLNPTTSTAAITVADISRHRVRAEVDERDISYIKLGQRVSVISEFDKSLQLSGKVSHIESEMGRRTIKSTDPADKNDRDVLEVMIDLEANAAAKTLTLPIGLRVVAVFGR